MSFKLGKKPATVDDRDFKLGKYMVTLPSVPSRFGHGSLFPNWGMLGNDNYGDCVFAGAAHETMLYNKLAKRSVGFTDKSVLSDYSAVTGFDPQDPNTDQGTNVRDAMKFRRSVGVVDKNGGRHKIDAYVSIPAKDFHMMLTAVYIFGAVGIGFEFPSSAMEQFDQGQPWDVVAGSQIEGGHYVCMVGSMHSVDHATCVTWGKHQYMTRAFYEQYNDEAWVPLSLELLNSTTGMAPHGLNQAALQADLKAL